MSSIPHREIRRKVQKKLSELRLESFIFKNRKRINCTNIKKYLRVLLEISSLQEPLGIFEEANKTYDRILLLLSDVKTRRSRRPIFPPGTLKRMIQCAYNRIGVNYMLMFLFEDRNIEQRQYYYINASYYMKMCLEKYLLKDEDYEIRSSSLTNLGLINLYVGDTLRASRFFRECLGFPFIKKTATGFHNEDDQIVGDHQLIALSNLLITMFSSGDDIGVEILSQNMFLDITCLSKNRVSSIMLLLLNSLSCLFQKDYECGEKKLMKAKEMFSSKSDPAFLNSFMKEMSQSFVILK